MNRSFFLRITVLSCLLLSAASGCQSGLFTILYLINGPDVKPKYEFLLKGKKRVAVVCRSMVSNQYDIQNAPREIARKVGENIDVNIQNRNLEVVDSSKIDAWLDDCNNDFDTFAEVGRAKTINADIVIGVEIMGFQLRDPHSHYLIQGKCQATVRAIDCKTGEVLASENLSIVDPPSGPIPSGGAGMEAAFRPQFISVVATQISTLFHHHDPNKTRRIDADNLEMHRM